MRVVQTYQGKCIRGHTRDRFGKASARGHTWNGRISSRFGSRYYRVLGPSSGEKGYEESKKITP
jgi:hypothetical protein